VDCICCAVGFTGLPYSLASDASRSRLSVVRVTPSRRLEVEKPSLVCLVIAVLIVDCTQEEGTKLMLTLLYSPHTSRTLSLEPTIPLSSVCYLFHLVCDGFEVLVRFLVLHVLRLFVKIDLHHRATCHAPSDLEDRALTPHPIKDARVINRDILLSNRLDDFLRHDAASKSSNIMQLRSACSSTAYQLAVSIRKRQCTYNS
jgi:hypothetical protein